MGKKKANNNHGGSRTNSGRPPGHLNRKTIAMKKEKSMQLAFNRSRLLRGLNIVHNDEAQNSQANDPYELVDQAPNYIIILSGKHICTGGSMKLRCILLCRFCLSFIEVQHPEWSFDRKLEYAFKDCSGTKHEPNLCKRICISCVTDLKLKGMTEIEALRASALSNPVCPGANGGVCDHLHVFD
jgi:hypothetical protein